MITNLAKKKKRGFTLVEVIIVLAIIAIIAAIAIPNLTKVRQDSKRKADIQTCETIKRIVTTLVVDEKVQYKTSGTNTITLTFTGTNLGTLGVTHSSDITLKDVTDATLGTEYFNTIKKPQQDDGYKYIVNISNNGTVSNVKAYASKNSTDSEIATSN